MEMNRLSPALLASWLQGINHSDEELPAKHHQPRLLPPRRAEVLAVQPHRAALPSFLALRADLGLSSVPSLPLPSPGPSLRGPHRGRPLLAGTQD